MRRARWVLWSAVVWAWACDDGGSVAGGGADQGGGTEGQQDASPVDAAPPADAARDAAPPAPDQGPPCPAETARASDGTCRPTCNAGTCLDGHCAPTGVCEPGPCSGDADCVGDGWCDDGRCRPPCVNDGQCGLGRLCEGGRCTKDPACADAEICGNGADDDCTGVIDDPDQCGGCVADQSCDTGLTGDCAPGRTVCEAENTTCAPIAPLGDELCNGIDDDCDGTLDEGYETLGEACDLGGVGDCAGRGSWVCSADGTQLLCRGDDEAMVERCNGLDDDCDGRIDETWPTVGDECADGVGRCAARGRVRCSEDGAEAACDVAAGQPVDEACNGLDDDCDGTTDEGFGDVGQPCAAGEGACRVEGTVRCADDAQTTFCSATPMAPGVEDCNGLDDDCDGAVDEGLAGAALSRACFEGPADARGRGVCMDGEQICVDGRWGACEGAVGPGNEQCNGLDDDCNGAIDDDGRGGSLRAPCYTGDPNTLGLGACTTGVQRCVLGEFTACEGEVVPRAEVCDQTDEDCDGAIDEGLGGCECEAGETRACYGGLPATRDVGRCVAGEQACGADLRWGPCEGAVLPAAEQCNGVDDDCDGTSDEGVVGGQAACSVGVGACRAEGTRVCDPQAGQVGCDVEPGVPAGERCDGLDNDCDGRSDEAFPVGTFCTGGVGACRAGGTLACNAENEVECAFEPGEPIDELCNGADDDCDGRVDEGFDVGVACSAGDGACARGGVKVCAGVRRTTCDAVPGQSTIEACNGEDDDCDGFVDEGQMVGVPCRVGVGVCETLGVRVCAPEGGTVCNVAPPAPGVETCNGLDDDCDGRSDEGLGVLGPCNTGRPGVCAAGQRVCVNGAPVCQQTEQGDRETCDGVDEDCDGRIDEAQGQQACGLGPCRRVLPACLDGEEVECDPLVGALPDELCNNIDDDCDGRTDEDTTIDGQSCGVGVGACARAGTARCVDGARVCDAVAGQPTNEACDGEDDDCDGRVDEDSIGAQERCFAGEGGCRVFAQPVCVDGARVCPAEPAAPGDEVCNGEDDDCDGQLDEGFASVTCGLGVCLHAVPACDGGQPEPCDPLQGAANEVCNGLDDDCDGAVDEQTPGVGEACARGVGPCRAEGLTVCAEGRIQCGAVPGAPGDELCNGLDDDCDGRQDEAPVDVGQPCGDGIGGCRQDGRIVCRQGSPVCDAAAFEPQAELCNGRDDDCDGASDEELGTFVCGRGVCRRTLAQCSDGGPVGCAPFEGATPEVCDNEDDDCDGRVDEEAEGAGGPCAVGVGACRREGTATCLGGAVLCDARPGLPRFETCNGADDDCDGTTDEGFDLGAACTAGEGACAAQGVRVCAGDGAVTCDAAPGAPGAETCNGVDDDCDGVTDEAAGPPDACDTGAPGVCAAGVPVCRDGARACEATAQATDEVCNGLDDDCDGSTDEGLGTIDCGRGICARALPACTDGAPTRCEPREGAEAAERCDGEDDDCDGFVDEFPLELGQPCTAGEGACARGGALRCTNGNPVCNVAAGSPVAERCNGADDDCDGTIDEEAFDVGQACANGVGACRREGARVCEDGARVCPVEPGAGSDEVCNGIDDDCDGTADEGFAGGIPCGVGACARVIPTCDGQQPGQCDPLAGATDEVCNGIDDDCDGTTDEDVAEAVGTPCFGGRGACTAAGLTACVDGEYRCDAAVGLPGDEVCNGVDDDCDGRTDEQPGDVGQPCESGVGVCARPGRVICSSGVPTCDVAPGPAGAETCNGLDDDCDGTTDEAQGSIVCGQGVCRRSLGACTDGAPAVCDPTAGASDERCNGADDDCDGFTDEGLGTVRCGEGRCDHEAPRCQNGQIVPCDPVLGARPETCDGVDDDCDGAVDEGAPGTGVACAVGVGECTRTGRTVCQGGGLRCDAVAGAPTDELCNSDDDDCDGAVDEETVDTGNVCRSGELGECNGAGITFCRQGEIVCPAMHLPPSPELCDGLDNDCDGIADQAAPDGPDCDGNLRNDDCELALGDQGDCNGNGVPDVCDIAAGIEEDCNRNGVPDGCGGDGAGCFDPVPPTVIVHLNPGVAPPETEFQVIVEADDDQGLIEVSATIDGQPLPLDANGQARFTRFTPGPFVVRARAIDFGGNVVTDEVEGVVTDPTDVTAPVVALATPLEGAVIDTPTRVTGTVSDANLLRWWLHIGPPADPEQRTLAVGTDPVANGRLGIIDVARLLPPGAWTLRLRAVDFNGAASAVDRTIVVAGCAPRGEECDGADNDCDGQTDESGACPDLGPPLVSIDVQPPLASPGSPVTVTVTAIDDIGVVATTLTIDGQPRALGPDGTFTYTPAGSGVYEAVATARDAEGNVGEARDFVRVQVAADVTPPRVFINSPADTTRLGIDPVTVLGDFEDANPYRYLLQVSTDAATWTTVSEGLGPRDDEPVGDIDPTTLAAGVVFVRLVGEDVNGASNFHQVAYVVPEGLSVGELQTRVRDLNVPLRGIPITIDRAYDSRDRSPGDFGHGWRLEAQRTRVTEDIQSNVGVVLPDGRREVFAIAYAFPPIFPFGTISYHPPAGVHSTLVNEDECLAVNSPQGVVCFSTGRPPAASISRYRLTTRDGTVYRVHDQQGLLTVTSPGGDVITFDPDRIHSTTGVEVRLDRDPEGRITRVTDPLGGIISYHYDARGDLVRVVDQAGGEQLYGYDADHFLRDVIGPDGHRMRRTEYADGRKVRDIDALDRVITYDHDLEANTEVVTDRRGGTTTYTYDDAGRMLRRVDALGNEGTFTYDAAGNLLSETLPDGRTYSYAYDGRGLMVRQTDPDGGEWQVDYDDFGQVIEMIDPAGNRVAFAYDGPGRPTLVENSDGERFTFAYDAAGDRVSQTDALGNVYTFEYDDAGNVTQVNGPEGYTRSYTLDAASRVVETVGPRGARVGYRYDAIGRMVGVELPTGETWTFGRDGSGRMSALVNGLGHRTEYTYEPRGLLESVTQAGHVTTFAYDEEGDLARMTDALGRETVYANDVLGRLVRRTDPLGQVATWAYDPVDRLLQSVDEAGVTTTYQYDVAGRLTRAARDDGEAIDIGHDAVGQPITLSDGDAAVELDYDPDGRVVQVETTHAGRTTGLAFTYGARGRRASRVDATGMSTYGYDDRGLLTAVTDPEGAPVTLVRDGQGNITALTLPGGTVVTYTYDLAQRCTGYEARDPQGATIAGETLELDDEGRPTRIDRADGTVTTLTWDARGQLVDSLTVDAGGATVRAQSYVYDAVGNRTREIIDGLAYDYVYDANDRLLDDGRHTYAYDALGNRTQRTHTASGDVDAYTYDGANRLIGWSFTPAGAGQPTRTASYAYDARGERIARTVDGVTTWLVQDADHRAVELDDQGAVRARYLHGGDVDRMLTVRRDGETYGYVTDSRGGVVALVDADGDVVSRFTYDDFGTVLDAEGPLDEPHRFATRPYDAETGLYHFRARAYDPTVGRFLQRDPERGTRMAPLSLNLYLFARNDPYTGRDPDGRVAVISYAWKVGQIFGLNASADAPNYYDMIGSLIGFFHGFSTAPLVFLANILDLASSGQDVASNWGVAIERTQAKMDEIKNALGGLKTKDKSGFQASYVNGAKFRVGIKITLKSPVDLPEGFCTPAKPGNKKQCKEEMKVEKSAGGFANGVANFIDYVTQLAPR